MPMFHAMNVSSSALTAQRLRLDVISSNMANVDTTREKVVNGEWQPYRRKMVVMEPNKNSFSATFKEAMGQDTGRAPGGVKVSRIMTDPTPDRLVYDPEHPDANEEGYVSLPNVDPLREMVDMISATRSYEANVTVMNASKGMLMKALEIGK